MVGRIVNSILLFLLGVVVGLIGTVAHQSHLPVLGIEVPWGIVVALLTVTCLILGLRLVNERRGPAFSNALGTVLAVALLSQKSVGGSVLIPSNTLGVLWIFGPVVIATVVLAWPDTSAWRSSGTNSSGESEEGPALGAGVN